jgi:hypothetical protein
MWDKYTLERLSIFTRDTPIFSSERMLHKNYDRKGLVVKKNDSGRESQEAGRQDKLIGGKLYSNSHSD